MFPETWRPSPSGRPRVASEIRGSSPRGGRRSAWARGARWPPRARGGGGLGASAFWPGSARCCRLCCLSRSSQAFGPRQRFSRGFEPVAGYLVSEKCQISNAYEFCGFCRAYAHWISCACDASPASVSLPLAGVFGALPRTGNLLRITQQRCHDRILTCALARTETRAPRGDTNTRTRNVTCGKTSCERRRRGRRGRGRCSGMFRA